MVEQSNYIPALKFNWLTKFYDPIVKLVMPEQKFKERLIHGMRIGEGQRVLDFGCGSLTLSILGSQKYPKAEYYGVDVDKNILDIASKKMKAANQYVSLQHYDGDTLPYPDNFFDKVMSSLVFHHLTLGQKYSALKDIYRILKPGGELHIADFGKPSNVLQRVGFYSIQLLDGFETTSDSVNNILPMVMKESRFLNIEETKAFNTLVGTVRLMKGSKLNKQNISKSIL